MDRAARAIPPAWPLASSVAVNPFLGQTDETLAKVGARLARVAGARRHHAPAAGIRRKSAAGVISDADLAAALASAPAGLETGGCRGAEGRGPRRNASRHRPCRRSPTLRPASRGSIGRGSIAERFGAWAAGYFDEGQALWAAPKGKGAYAAWRAVATHDLTPEIAGLGRLCPPCIGGAGNRVGGCRTYRRAARPRCGRRRNLLPSDAHDAWRLGALCPLQALAGGTRRAARTRQSRISWPSG